MVKILIGNSLSKIVGHLPDNVHKELDKTLSYMAPGAVFSKKYKEGKWDGRIRFYYKSRGQSFYSGLLSIVAGILAKHEIPFRKQDIRKVPEQNIPFLEFQTPIGFQKRDYQDFTVSQSILKTRGIMKLATGGGKTLVTSQLIGEIKTSPFMFYVLTKDLLDQAHDTLSSTLNVPVGRIGAGHYDIKDINVCTIQSVIRSIKNDKTFKVSDYMFDSEDVWDDKDILSYEKTIAIRKLLGTVKGLYLDECVTGDTIIHTEFGRTRIDEVNKNNCRYVLSYDGNKTTYNKISKWMDKGVRSILQLDIENGQNIKCTKDHLVYTNQGWKEAGKIKVGEWVLSVNVGAEVGLSQTNTEEKESISLDIGLGRREVSPNGKRNLKNMPSNHQNAYVDVEELSFHAVKRLRSLSKTKDLRNIQSTYMDTTNKKTISHITSNQLKKKYRQLWEHVLETPASSFQTRDQKTTDLLPLMDGAKKNGQSTKLQYYIDLGLKSKDQKTKGMEKSLQKCGLDAYHPLLRCLRTFMKMGKNIFPKLPWIRLETLGWLGGSAMMEAIPTSICPSTYIQKDFLNSKTNLFVNGSTKTKCPAPLERQDNTTCLDLMSKGHCGLLKKYDNMFQNACSTSWKTVTKITEPNEENVYDISVENDHCFFGNSVLIHNCHHASSQMCRDIMGASPNAYWRYGGTATPYREDNAEIVLQGLFGKKIVDISTSYLIEKGYLITPYILFDPILHENVPNAYQSTYSHCVTKNDEFHDHVAKTARHLISNNLSTLILVQRYAHGEALKKLIPNTEFVTGKMSSKKRSQAIQDLRDKKKLCMIATTLADEGLDIPTLDAALLAGGGASATRVYQRVGRTLRPDRSSSNPRDRSIVVVYDHKARHLDKQTRKVRKLLKVEKEFNLINSAGGDHILSEIDEIMNLQSSSSIFDI